MLRIRHLLAIAAVVAQPYPGYSSLNVSAIEWECNSTLALQFTGGSGPLVCGDEELQGITGVMPKITLALPSPAPTYVTLLVVDRDAPSSQAPVRSPLRHMAISRVPGALLATGVDESILASASGAEFFFNYSGPQPPAGTLCHRYYVQVYAETGGPPALNISASGGRYTWDFPTWAASQNLTKLAVGMWRTQNAGARVGGCDGTPSSTSSALSLGLGIGLPLGLAALASLWFARAPLQRLAAGFFGKRSGTQRASVRRAGGSFLDDDLTGDW